MQSPATATTEGIDPVAGTLLSSEGRVRFMPEDDGPPLFDLALAEITKLRFGFGNNQQVIRLWAAGQKWVIGFAGFYSDDAISVLGGPTVEAYRDNRGARDLGRVWMKELGGKR